MKLSIFAIVAASATANKSVRNRRQNDDRNSGEKRYSQLIDQMSAYNNDFDERQYWTYGCHCLMLGKYNPTYNPILVMNDLGFQDNNYYFR